MLRWLCDLFRSDPIQEKRAVILDECTWRIAQMDDAAVEQEYAAAVNGYELRIARFNTAAIVPSHPGVAR